MTTPPGTYKSRTFLVCLPAWGWLHNPAERFLCGTNDYDLGLELSRDCRSLIESGWYRNGLRPPFEITSEKDAQELFTNNRGGQRQVISVGSTATGKKATRLILDDAHDARQVHSPTVRASDKRWFFDSFWDRVDNFRTDGILVVGHRLQRDDLEGELIRKGWPELRLMERMERSYLLPFPLGGTDARAEGQYLRPSRFGPAEEEDVKRTGPTNWEAKHQQRPVTSEGTMFPRDTLPAFRSTWTGGLTAVRFWDTAASQSDTASHTSGVLLGYTPGRSRWEVVNVVRGRWGWAQRDEVIHRTAQEDARRSGMTVAAVVIEHPGGSGGLQTWQILAAKLAAFPVFMQPTSGRGGKPQRAGPFSGQWQAGNVSLVDDGSWDVAGYLDRMEGFPALSDTDDADASAGAFNYLASGGLGSDVDPAAGSGVGTKEEFGEGTFDADAYRTDFRGEKF